MKKASRFNIDVESLLFLTGQIYIYWKDIESTYISCNDALAEILQLPSRAACNGTTDYDHQVQEATSYRQADKEIITLNQSRQYSETFTLNEEKINFLTFKTPLKNQNNKIIGVFGISFPLNNNSKQQWLSALVEANMPLSNFQRSNLKPTNHINLSKQQTECLYWLTKGMTLKKIAQLMKLSPRTVEAYFDVIKKKLNCYTRSDLIEVALKIPTIKQHLFN